MKRDVGDTASLDGIDAIDQAPEPDDEDFRALAAQRRIRSHRTRRSDMTKAVGWLGVFMLAGACAEAAPSSSVRPLWFKNHQICTASSINQRIGLWLTAQHCVSDGAPQVEDRSDPEHPFHQTTIVWVGVEDDLAVLFTVSLRVPALALSEVAPVVGDDVQYFSYPLTYPAVQFVRGHLASLDTHITDDEGTVDYGRVAMFAMGTCYGSSGAAVLDVAGHIVSVVKLMPGAPCSPFMGGTRFERLRQIARFFDER